MSRTEDVVWLLVASAELLRDPDELSRVAHRHGHPMMPPAAAKFAERVLLDEAAYALLHSRRYKEFLRGLHTPAPHPLGGADVSAEAEAAAASMAEDAVVPSQTQPPSLGAIGGGRSLVVDPAVIISPHAAPQLTASAPPPLDATPEGGETKAARAQRLARKRKQRKDTTALQELEGHSTSSSGEMQSTSSRTRMCCHCLLPPSLSSSSFLSSFLFSFPPFFFLFRVAPEKNRLFLDDYVSTSHLDAKTSSQHKLTP